MRVANLLYQLRPLQSAAGRKMPQIRRRNGENRLSLRRELLPVEDPLQALGKAVDSRQRPLAYRGPSRKAGKKGLSHRKRAAAVSLAVSGKDRAHDEAVRLQEEDGEPAHQRAGIADVLSAGMLQPGSARRAAIADHASGRGALHDAVPTADHSDPGISPHPGSDGGHYRVDRCPATLWHRSYP